MDINDLRNLNVQDRGIEILLKDATGKEFEFKTLYQLQDFLVREIEYWENVNISLDYVDKVSIEELKNYNLGLSANKKKDRTIYSILATGLYLGEIWGDFKIRLANENPIQNHDFELALNSINRINDLQYSKYWVCSESDYCKKGIEILDKLGATAANSFFEAFLLEQDFTSLGTMEGLKGAMLAYEFQMQNERYLDNRITLEEESVSGLRNNILEIRDNLYMDVSNSKNEFERWIKDAAKKYNDTSQNQVDKFKKEHEKWSEKVDNLENTYKEKLRLEPAASYWKTKAEDYKKLGNRWALILSVFVAVGLGIFGVLFYTWVNAQTTAISIDSLQGVVLFITLLSVYAFAIKALSKLVFSSYHLQRDAEEREQLTYLYLSLTHEKDDFDTDARSIVLQALFSRADTGLISGDSSPTMPGVHEIINASSNR